MGKSRVIMICNLEEHCSLKKILPKTVIGRRTRLFRLKRVAPENGGESVHRMLGYIEAPGAERVTKGGHSSSKHRKFHLDDTG